MSIRDFGVTTLHAFLGTIAVVLSISIATAQVMQSTSYRIQSDSVNFGGGLSSSTSYTLESTAGEVATGDGSSASYNLRAGYQQMTTNYLAMTAASSVIMTPSIPGISGGTANGSTTVTVTTDNPAGYTLSIVASGTPALTKGADSIADYVPGGVPDFTFTTNASDSHFGYSPEGVDVVTRFKDNGSVCNINNIETTFACWDGLDIVSETIAQRASANTPNGSTTTVNFRVGIGGSVVQTAGLYTATTTLTALSL